MGLWRCGKCGVVEDGLSEHGGGWLWVCGGGAMGLGLWTWGCWAVGLRLWKCGCGFGIVEVGH